MEVLLSFHLLGRFYVISSLLVSRLFQPRAKRFRPLSNVAVFDLLAELPENAFSQKTADYHCFAMLDMASTADVYIQESVNIIFLKRKESDTAGKIYTLYEGAVERSVDW